MSKKDRDDGERFAYLYLTTKHTVAQHLCDVITKDVMDRETGNFKRGLAILE